MPSVPRRSRENLYIPPGRPSPSNYRSVFDRTGPTESSETHTRTGFKSFVDAIRFITRNNTYMAKIDYITQTHEEHECIISYTDNQYIVMVTYQGTHKFFAYENIPNLLLDFKTQTIQNIEFEKI